jgi:hypothetical protein
MRQFLLVAGGCVFGLFWIIILPLRWIVQGVDALEDAVKGLK